MLRQGSGSPLVLLHGVTGSETMWSWVVPLLAPHHDVVAVTALGHRGGRPAETGTRTRIRDVVDDAERQLDDLGFERPHLAGNSMGGWVALELARRGRAASVCALSPAGCWEPGTRSQTHGTSRLRALAWVTRLGRPMLPLLARSGRFRAVALRDTAAHGERVSAGELIQLADDLLACAIREDILRTDERLAPLDPLPCPVVLAWAERDRILPADLNGTVARQLIPQATWRLLPDVGHVPMLDDPQLVADAILDTTRLAAGSAP